jgi:hypothetical protein
VLRDLHSANAWFVIVANGVVGSWALVAHWWPAGRRRSLWVSTAVAELAVGVEVALGVALQVGRRTSVDQFHAFYGFVAFATVGIIYSYRTQLAEHRYLLYGGGGLFLMGLGLRSLQFAGDG